MALRRILTIAGLKRVRLFRSPVNVLWIVVIPVLLSFAASLLFSGGIAPDERGWTGGRLVLFEPPRGTLMEAERRKTADHLRVVPHLRDGGPGHPGVGAFHEERRRGRCSERSLPGALQRGGGGARDERRSARAIQAAVVVAVTSAFGAPWLASGWWVMILTVAGAFVACSGMAVAVAGVARSDGELQLISGAVPSLLAMSGGVFFTLEAAPAEPAAAGFGQSLPLVHGTAQRRLSLRRLPESRPRPWACCS